MSEEPLRQDPDFDRASWRAHARRSIQEAFDALESGRLHFGDWERLFLSAAIDHFRDRHFEQASMSAQRIFSEHQRPPFYWSVYSRKEPRGSSRRIRRTRRREAKLIVSA